MKFAVDRALDDKRYETTDIGVSLERVLRHWTIRSKFNGIHPTLVENGIEAIGITNDGFMFYHFHVDGDVRAHYIINSVNAEDYDYYEEDDDDEYDDFLSNDMYNHLKEENSSIMTQLFHLQQQVNMIIQESQHQSKLKK